MGVHQYSVDLDEEEIKDCNNCGAQYRDIDIEPGVRNREGLCPGCLFMQDEEL